MSVFGMFIYLQRLNRIVIPIIEFDHDSIEEAIDFLSARCVDMDPDPDPTHRGVSILTKRPRQPVQPEIAANPERIIITYSGKAVPFLVALAEVARQAYLDIYLTEIGIVICQIGDPPFPNTKAKEGEVWKTIYKSKAKPTQPRKGEHAVPSNKANKSVDATARSPVVESTSTSPTHHL